MHNHAVIGVRRCTARSLVLCCRLMCCVCWVSAQCAALEDETVLVERTVEELTERHIRREAEACVRDQEVHEMQQRLDTTHQRLATLQMTKLTIDSDTQQSEERERKAEERVMKKMEGLQQTHTWHSQHRLPAVREAAQAAGYGAGDAMDDRAEVFASSNSSESSNRAAKKKRKTGYTAKPRVAHSVQTIGGHSGGGGEISRHAKVVQVTHS